MACSGGSSLRHYLEKVARHHGLEFAVTEYEKAEGNVHDESLVVVLFLISHGDVATQILDHTRKALFT